MKTKRRVIVAFDGLALGLALPFSVAAQAFEYMYNFGDSFRLGD